MGKRNLFAPTALMSSRTASRRKIKMATTAVKTFRKTAQACVWTQTVTRILGASSTGLFQVPMRLHCQQRWDCTRSLLWVETAIHMEKMAPVLAWSISTKKQLEGQQRQISSKADLIHQTRMVTLSTQG